MRRDLEGTVVDRFKTIFGYFIEENEENKKLFSPNSR
jgi:hypothetical protein